MLLVSTESSDVETLAGIRVDVLSKQRLLMGLAGSVIVRKIVDVFDLTQRLQRLRISIYYEWECAEVSPKRRQVTTVGSTFSEGVVGESLISTALERPLWSGDATSVSDVEVDFNLAVEASEWLRAIASDLDCGLPEARIDVSRSEIKRFRDKKSGRTDLSALGRLILHF